MCGRFALWNDKNRLLEHYGLDEGTGFDKSYNVTPSNWIPVLRGQQQRELVNCHWGLVPHWARDRKLQPINARADSLQKKPFFRDAYSKRRCLIPANGYYEWKKIDRRKQPWFIRMQRGELFSFAGLWDSWDSPEGSIESCAIITTEASPLTADIHKRMPLIIAPEDYDNWLNRGDDTLIRPWTGHLQTYPVSTRVNNPQNQGEDLVQAL